MTIGSLEMEKEAYYKSGIFSWAFIPTYIIMALIQFGFFCLYNGSFHPMYCVVATETTGNDKNDEENIAKTEQTQIMEQISEVMEKCEHQNQKIQEIQTIMNSVLPRLTELEVEIQLSKINAGVANTSTSLAETRKKLEILPQIN